jgi:hypothetical protein
MNIEAKIITVGSWEKVSIVAVQYGYTQHLENGQWVNSSSEPERHETEILTIGKHFESYKAAEKYMGTKFFKNLLKQVQKGGF